ncbi:MAG: ATP synthase F1 subunit delta [Oscillospiraceae bacterium]|nr:ATP synthase F1 subunit delta [Oscillospiraceae bacterium]
MIDAAGYGKALFELAAEEGTDERIFEELALLRKVLGENPSYVTLLDTPAVNTEEKLSLIRKAFGNVDPILLNFLSILCEKRSVYRLPACADAYNKLHDEARNILRATAITAVAMTAEQRTALKEKLAMLTGKTVILDNQTDAGLIGGITLRYGGVQLDDSIRSRLDKLQRSLSQTIV